MYFVYLARGSKQKLYTGVTKNPAQRIKYHNSKRGAVFTRNSKSVIVFLEGHTSLSEARKREIQIKKWRRAKKETLIQRYEMGLPTKLEKLPR